MNKISNITKNLDFKAQGDKSTRSEEFKKNVGKLALYALNAAIDAKPHGYKQYDTAEKEEGARTAWYQGFMEQKLFNVRYVNIGLERLRAIPDTEWFPSIGKFISLCRPTPDNFGLPSVLEAFKEAVRFSHPCEITKNWSHPIIYNVWKMSDRLALTRAPRPDIKPNPTYKLFEYNYSQLVKSYADGKVLDDIPVTKAIDHTPTITSGVALDAIKNIRNLLK